jgi:predicted MFS family arabinose efflux permease
MRALVFVSLTGFTSFCLTLASLPSWAVAGGASPATAGLVTAVMLTCTVLTQTVVPVLAARLGLARVFALGLLAMGVPAPLYLFDNELWWLLLVSSVRGAGFAVVTVIGATMTARIAPPERRGEAIGIYSLSSSLPNLLAVPAGVALTLSGSFAWVAVLAAAPVLAIPLVRALGPMGAHEEEPDEGEGVPGRLRGAALAAAGPAGVLLVVTLATSGLVTFLPIERPDGVLATVSLLVFGVTAALTRWRAGAFADRIGSRVLLPAGLCLSAAGLSTVASGLSVVHGTSGEALILLGAAVFGTGYGAVQNLTLVAAFGRAGRDGAATASAVWNGAFDAGLAVGAVVVGAGSATGLGLPWTYAACALAIGLSLPLALAMAPPRRTG